MCVLSFNGLFKVYCWIVPSVSARLWMHHDLDQDNVATEGELINE